MTSDLLTWIIPPRPATDVMKLNFMNEICFRCLRNFIRILCALLWCEMFVLLNDCKSIKSGAFLSIHFCGWLVFFWYDIGFQEGNPSLQHCDYGKTGFALRRLVATLGQQPIRSQVRGLFPASQETHVCITKINQTVIITLNT